MIYLIILLVLLIATDVFLYTEPSDRHCKEFVLNHQDKIIKRENNFYVIPFTDRRYYQDVSIRKMEGEAYSIIFWGNRKSWLWRFKLDKSVDVNIPYRESKGKDVILDLQILDAISH